MWPRVTKTTALIHPKNLTGRFTNAIYTVRKENLSPDQSLVLDESLAPYWLLEVLPQIV